MFETIKVPRLMTLCLAVYFTEIFIDGNPIFISENSRPASRDSLKDLRTERDNSSSYSPLNILNRTASGFTIESPYEAVQKVITKLQEDFDGDHEDPGLTEEEYLTFTGLSMEEKAIYIAILAVPVLMSLILCFCCCLCIRFCLCPGFDQPFSSNQYSIPGGIRNRRTYQKI